jgi:hypothetical protein
MHLLREPWRFVILWTALCAIPVYWLIEKALQPVDPRCFEYCGLYGEVAGIVVPTIMVIWIAVSGLVIWIYRRRQ